MTDAELFEQLKQTLLRDYIGYLKTIENLTYKDLNNMQKRVELIKKYKEAIVSNTAYRHFILTRQFESFLAKPSPSIFIP